MLLPAHRDDREHCQGGLRRYLSKDYMSSELMLHMAAFKLHKHHLIDLQCTSILAQNRRATKRVAQLAVAEALLIPYRSLGLLQIGRSAWL